MPWADGSSCGAGKVKDRALFYAKYIVANSSVTPFDVGREKNGKGVGILQP